MQWYLNINDPDDELDEDELEDISGGGPPPPGED